MAKRNPNDYGHLTPTLQKSCKASIESLQEGGPRELKATTAFITFRFGVICETDENGTPRITVTSEDRDMTGGSIRQAFFIGARAEADTKVRKFVSANLRTRRMPRPFRVTSQMDQLLIQAIPPAQKEGDDVQRKIDDTQYKWYPLHFEEPSAAHVDLDPEPDPDLILIKNLTALAYGTVAEQLGSRVEKLQVVFAKWTDGAVMADSFGTEVDILIPRARLVIMVKTTSGSESFGAIGGSSGTLLEMMTRDVPEEKNIPAEKLAKDPEIISKDPNVIVTRLARRVAREAEKLDRAQGTAILGKECYVILPSQATGVFVHEMIGHPHEADIIVENDRDPKAKIKLKGTLGARVSNHQKFAVYDTGEPDYQVGERRIRFSWGGMPAFDEYGVACKTAVLVEGGRNTGVMSDHVTFEELADGMEASLAEKMREVGLTGSSRSQKFDVTPQVRMRTTFATPDDEKGPKTVHEMAAMIPKNAKGIYVKSINGGWVNTSDGTFMLNVNLGYLIENGQITDKPIKNIKLGGNVTTFQDNIMAIGASSTVKFPFTGFCGKGLDGKENQWVPVEGIGPAMLLQKITLGGGGYMGAKSWNDLVSEYNRQHMEVLSGKRLPNAIHIPEIAEDLPPDASQENVCLVTSCFASADAERDWMYGRMPDNSTHEMKADGTIRERRKLYDHS